MTFEQAFRDLELIRTKLSGQFIIDDNVNTQHPATISWSGYQKGIHNHVNYMREYMDVIDNRQFSFLLEDGGAVQIYYQFEGEILRSARQCYFPNPVTLPSSLDGDWRDLELTLDEVLSTDDTESPFRASSWSHVRFDYDADANSHDAAHLQHSAINNLRFPSNKIMTSSVFMDFILYNFYRSRYEVFSKKAWYEAMLAIGRSHCLVSSISDGGRAHIAAG